MKKLLCILLFIGYSHAKAQIKSVQFEQVDSLQKIEKRNVVIFIHTDWCKYCQLMKSTSLKNNSVIDFLNKHFYFIDFNAEENRNIIFRNTIFKFKPTGNNTGIHELAEQLGTVDGKVVYPSLCVVNPMYEITFQHNGFLSAIDLMDLFRKLK